MVLVVPIFKHIRVKARTEMPAQTDQTTHFPAAQSESCLSVFWPQPFDAMQDCISKLKSNMDGW